MKNAILTVIFFITFLLGMLTQEIYHVKAVKTIHTESPKLIERANHVMNH